MITQHAGDGIGTDHGLPAVGFGQFVSNPPLAPGRMLGPERHDLGFKGGARPRGQFRRRTGEVLKGRIPALVEPGFPIIKGAASNVRGAACLHNVAGGFPGFKQEPPLLSGRQRKVNTFRHRSSIPKLGWQCKGCLTTTQLNQLATVFCNFP